ncbi:caspase family protein [Phanerochaete sordida]|uniref:Caspase family protein n=1 Tax=Phanerochaete sordida TaxID=48140 RepID=A0A9P3G024_9APHY|nr:caspase family protein [Phanerochaete sordida]
MSPKQKALLVGIRYANLSPRWTLESTYTDVHHLREFLISTLKFRREDIVEMTDDLPHDDDRYPNHANLLKQLQALAKDADPGDHLVFHFSGHGSQKPDQNKDESDGQDETIWPADVEIKDDAHDDADNVILDDTIKAELVDKLPDEAHLVIILDCCHSGTGADLKYTYTDHVEIEPGRHEPVDQTAQEPPKKLAMPGLTGDKAASAAPPTMKSPGVGAVVVSWAACQDPRFTISFSNSGGCFVKAFIDAFHEHKDATHQELLQRIKVKMASAAEGHFEENRHRMTDADWEQLQGWWKTARTEPVLGVLHDYRKVLDTPVAQTFGGHQRHHLWPFW